MVTTFEVANGRTLRAEQCESLAAASARLPEGAYTSVRTYGGHKVLRLREHVRRLEESLRLLGRPAPLDEGEARSAIAAALQATGHSESRLRLTFAPPRLFVSVEPFVTLPDSAYREGVWCVTLPMRRNNPHSKDTRFIAEAADAYRRLPSEAEEGLMVDEDGALLEGLSSNFFAVLEGTLHTEEARALPGVTRSLVLELAQEVMPVSRTAIRVDQLPQVRECFITSVSRGILPVVRIGERTIRDGKPGPLTRKIMGRYAALVEREAESVRPPT